MWTNQFTNIRNVINFFDEENDEASCAVNVFWRRKWWSIMCCNMDRLWETFFDEKNFIRHYVPYNELDVAWNVNNIFDEKKWWNKSFEHTPKLN